MNRIISAVIILFAVATEAFAADTPLPGTVTIPAAKPFEQLVADLEAAVEKNGMGIVTRASASKGAAGRGIQIPGNIVVGVFRNDFAVRMLEASIAAGIEAPLRYYLTETGNDGATLTYRRPSAVFAPYDRLAAELDPIFHRIAEDAVR